MTEDARRADVPSPTRCAVGGEPMQREAPFALVKVTYKPGPAAPWERGRGFRVCVDPCIVALDRGLLEHQVEGLLIRQGGRVAGRPPVVGGEEVAGEADGPAEPGGT